MQKIILFLVLWGIFNVPLYGEIWLVEQDFIKIDKKQLYEKAKKEEFSSLENSGFCFYDSKDREYIHLRAFDSFEALEEHRQGASPLLSSILNFRVATLQELQPHLSYGFDGDFQKNPYAAYQIFSLMPSGEKAFQEKLRQIVLAQETRYIWGVWKVVFGSELPKYVIGHFAPDEKTLAEQLKAVKLEGDEWVRRKEEGRAVLVPELSKKILQQY